MKHALIIEDNSLIVLMIQDHLRDCDYSFDIAVSQAKAIQFAERRCPDLITADDTLESGTGVEAIRHICLGKAIPVIFIVADPRSVTGEIPDALVLQKPFSKAALVAAIRHAEKAPLALCIRTTQTSVAHRPTPLREGT